MSHQQQQPVFNTFKRKLYRPFYSVWEFYAGIGVLVVALAVLGWVMWRGRKPDPDVFHVSEELLSNKGKETPIYKRPLQPWTEPGAVRAVAKSLGPFPEGVTSDGWNAGGGVQEFDASTLYEKIDGRETYYKGYGFERLFFLSLSKEGRTIDIELFNLGTIQNALGAFAGEISNPDVKLVTGKSGFSYTSRNAGFLAHGRFYARIIGSDETEEIRAKVRGVSDALAASLPGEELPWAYELFTARMKLSPRLVQYYARDAFTFGFANEVYSAKVKGDMEVFFSKRENAEAAGRMARQFAETIAGFAKRVQAPDGVTLLQNDTVGTFDAFSTEGVFVIGVYMAASERDALDWLNRLRDQIKATATPAASDEY
jgi:hypothetical protein